MTSKETTVWTLQHSAAWEHAQTTGVLKADGRRVDPYYRSAYRWMMQQMRDKGLRNCSSGYPLWAYSHKKPDLHSRHNWLEKGTPAVRLECVVPTNDILISHIGGWEEVLQGTYCSISKEDQEEHDATFGQETSYTSVWQHTQVEPMAHIRAIENSWQRIFDLDVMSRDLEWNGPADNLQATLGRISLEQVTNATYFTMR